MAETKSREEQTAEFLVRLKKHREGLRRVQRERDTQILLMDLENFLTEETQPEPTPEPEPVAWSPPPPEPEPKRKKATP